MDRAVNWVLRRGLSTPHVRLMSSANVRKTFIDFFELEHGHLVIPSSPVVPYQDPTIPFINSGMNQFKRVFLGEVVPASCRVANSQKCLRLRGKHSDLELIGLDGTHHTFFEMLGNWSFGDYFKKEACSMAWNLLTKVYRIPPERLYVTYFNGDESLSLPPDSETPEIWAEIGVPRDRILPFGLSDNFWEMAKTGPCGPCTEIHYDHVAGRKNASALVNSGSPEVTEVWNLVFMEYNRSSDQEMEKLRQHFVDTGMGLERLVAIMQGKTSNYETDLFLPLFDTIRRKSGHPGYTGTYGGSRDDVAYRILADHARTLTVSLSDGMLPKMDNRMRMVARNAFIISRKTFKVEKDLVKELTYHVAESLAPVYPEIGRRLDRVHYLLDMEEEAFDWRKAEAGKEWAKLLEKFPKFREIDVDLRPEIVQGCKYISKALKENSSIDSKTAWILFDTYGVPINVVTDIANILGVNFDMEEFKKFRLELLEVHRGENEAKFNAERNLCKDLNAQFLAMGLKETADDLRYKYDVEPGGGYKFSDVRAAVVAVVKDGQVVDRIDRDSANSERVAVVLDRTNFFPYSRDQHGDTGVFETDTGVRFDINSVERIGNQVLHYGKLGSSSGLEEISAGQGGVVRMNRDRRLAIMRSTTSMHVLRALLTKRVKTFVETDCHAGLDVVTLDYTSYENRLGVKDIFELENEVNDLIQSESTVRWQRLNSKDAWKMTDLITKPGETFIEAKAPVVEISGPNINARLSCYGLPVQIPELGDFVIIDYIKSAYRTMKIIAVTFEKAARAKENRKAFLEQWKDLRDFHVVQFEDEATVMENVQKITKFVEEVTQCELLSYYVKVSLKEECSSKLEKLRKIVRKRVRDERRRNKEMKSFAK